MAPDLPVKSNARMTRDDALYGADILLQNIDFIVKQSIIGGRPDEPVDCGRAAVDHAISPTLMHKTTQVGSNIGDV